MSKCESCDGRGIFLKGEKKCPECGGSGKAKKINLATASEGEISEILKGGAGCRRCNGSGIIEISEPCEACGGAGSYSKCDACGAMVPSDRDLCDSCKDRIIVYRLGPACDIEDLEAGKMYMGVADNIVDFGVFIDLNKETRGLLHNNDITRPPRRGEEIFVRVKSMRKDGKIDLEQGVVEGSYHLIEVEKDIPRTPISDLRKHVKKRVHVAGEVIGIRQTSGPTIFTVADETGLVQCAAFEKAGERAYPGIAPEMLVRVIGEVNKRNDGLQVEIHDLRQLLGKAAIEVKQGIDEAIDRRAEPSDVPFMVESPILEELRPHMRDVARLIRKNIFRGRPIIIRHHADADGMTAAVAIERAIIPLIREVGGPDAEYFYYRRNPSKAPFYELEDVTRDLTYALEDVERYGKKMPILLLLDNGSTEEDVPAMRQALIYGMELIVVDHHHPDDVVDQYLLAHVNPAHAGGDFGITTGMLATEIARMIRPDVEQEIRHLPAISAVGDRSEAPEADSYRSLVEDRYDLERLADIALALDYEAFWLRFNDGKNLVNDILNLGVSKAHRHLVTLLTEQARAAIDEQLRACLPNVKKQKLPNGALLAVLDVENYAHKFTFPPPGKTSGEVHDRLCQEYPGPVVTIGYGPDFAVLRSKDVRMNIPQMVRELREDLPGAGVNGGGHLVVGSIKFIGGKRKEVLARLAEKIGNAPV